MSTSSRMTRRAVVGGLVLLCLPALAAGQDVGQLRPVARIASIAAGSIQGIVQDEQGAPVAGAAISALGASSAFAVSDRSGRFEMRTLSPGPYLLRAHLTGFVASRGQVVDVRPSARASSSIALRHVSTASSTASYPVLAAGVGAAPDAPATAPATDPAPPRPHPATTITANWRGASATRGARFSRTRPSPRPWSPRTMRRRRRDSAARVRSAASATRRSGSLRISSRRRSRGRSIC